MRYRFPPVLLLPFLLFLGACQPVPEPDVRSVTVSGEGELSVAPEVATVRLAIQARDKTVERAQSQAGEVVAAVLKLTDSLDIPREQVQSTQLHVLPEYDWRDGSQKFRGYLVQREVRVEIEDLEKLGSLVERAMSAGVNNVMPPELSVKDPRALQREVMKLAAADARASAEALAHTLESQLGKVQRITSREDEPPRPMMEMQMMRAANSGGGEQTYETGRITVRAKVQVEFELR